MTNENRLGILRIGVIMKLISYRRVSSNKQVTEGDSLEGQKRTIEQWVKRRGHQIAMEFVDGGVLTSCYVSLQHGP